jgi:hypothetical protein
MNSFGIYTITNKKSGHFYIGSSNNVRKRLGMHLALLNRNAHPSVLLQNAYNEYPFVDCSYVPMLDRKMAYDMEKKEIVKHKDNTLLCNFIYSGKPLTDENKEKKRRKMKGRKLPAETIAKMKATFSTMDRSLSPERIEAIRQRRSGSKASLETKRKMSAAATGRVFTLERNLAVAKSKMIPVIINGVEYAGSTIAATALGESKQTVLNRIRSKLPRFTTWQFK